MENSLERHLRVSERLLQYMTKNTAFQEAPPSSNLNERIEGLYSRFKIRLKIFFLLNMCPLPTAPYLGHFHGINMG